MTRSRIWTMGTAAVVVGVILIGWFLLISPKRTEASTLKATAAATDEANRAVEAQIRQLKAEQKKLPAQRAQIAEIARQLPPQPLEPAMIRQISVAADTANVELASITPSALTAVSGVPGVQYIGTTIVVNGDFSHLKGFLDALEENKRAFLVTGVSIGASQSDPKLLAMTVTSRVFVATEAAPTTPTSATATGGGTATGSVGGSGAVGAADKTATQTTPTTAN